MKKTQEQAAYELLKQQPLTAKEAAEKHGIMHLHSVVSNLVKKGVCVSKTRINVPTRYGNGKTSVLRYRIFE